MKMKKIFSEKGKLLIDFNVKKVQLQQLLLVTSKARSWWYRQVLQVFIRFAQLVVNSVNVTATMEELA